MSCCLLVDLVIFWLLKYSLILGSSPTPPVHHFWMVQQQLCQSLNPNNLRSTAWNKNKSAWDIVTNKYYLALSYTNLQLTNPHLMIIYLYSPPRSIPSDSLMLRQSQSFVSFFVIQLIFGPPLLFLSSSEFQPPLFYQFGSFWIIDGMKSIVCPFDKRALDKNGVGLKDRSNRNNQSYP